MLNRIKQILQASVLSTEELSDENQSSNAKSQVLSIFEYFLEKLCSEKQSIRSGALRIFNRLFINSLPLPHILSGADEQLINQLSANVIDLNELIDAFKRQSGVAYEGVCELLIKYFKRAITVETNLDYLNVYIRFLIEHLPNHVNTDVEMTDKVEDEKMVIYNTFNVYLFKLNNTNNTKFL